MCFTAVVPQPHPSRGSIYSKHTGDTFSHHLSNFQPALKREKLHLRMSLADPNKCCVHLQLFVPLQPQSAPGRGGSCSHSKCSGANMVGRNPFSAGKLLLQNIREEHSKAPSANQRTGCFRNTFFPNKWLQDCSSPAVVIPRLFSFFL